jgi:hypothetical protein
MCILMANVCQFKGATKSTNHFYEKKSKFVTFQIHTVNFLKLNIISSYNIEGFKQISNSTTCLQPNVAKLFYGW